MKQTHNLNAGIPELHHIEDGSMKLGSHTSITGVFNIWGNTTNIYGDATRISGNVSNIHGNVTGIYGDVSNVIGDIDLYDISDADRELGISIYAVVDRS